MPTIARKQDSSLAAALFSNVQQRLLALIFGHPERSYYLSEIVRHLRSGTGAVDRELARLEKSGLISVERIGNQKHYRANEASPIFDELRGIIRKTVGLIEPLQRALEEHRKQIKAAFVYGSVAKKTDSAQSDIDLMIIGDDLVYSDLYGALQTAEESIGRSVNPTIMALSEWKEKQRSSSFVQSVSSQQKLFVLGSEADLR